ncbi:MAG: sigma-70 family RNA polymerase sigma factor [Clostridia bacterium]|nr:sigma-70 family RNA polymerase sigma factor [Clostridia bacterium]
MLANIERVIEQYSDMVYRIALTRTGTKENAEDIYQDVFLKYSQKAKEFESFSHEKAWLIKVTINMTKNFNNSSWNKKVVNLDENIKFETPEETGVYEVVCRLPQNYRTVIYLMYYEGYKINEISEMMKVKEGTIKTWAFRARELLKKDLEGGFENE